MKARSPEGQPARKLARISLRIEEAMWRTADLVLLRRAARAALAGAQRAGELTVLLTGDDSMRELNKKFRGKTKSTNVLSFPSAAQSGDGYLGDIAIAFGVAAHEAEAARKSVSDHAAHLVVHGVLHLLGYDHERARDAQTMEALEVAILKRLGIDDPYASTMAAE
jgi:probable rRNA maturation factor